MCNQTMKMLLPALSSSVLSIIAIVVIVVVIGAIIALVVLFLVNVPVADMLGFLVAMLWGGCWGVAMTFLRQADPKEINRAVVGCAYVGVALLRQLHPTVHEGDVLSLLDSVTVSDLVASWGVPVQHWLRRITWGVPQ